MPVRSQARTHMAGRPPRVSREEIARAALALADREGVDSLSMRRVADAVGVGTMTLYGHFRSRDELLDAIVDAVMEDAAPLELEGSWRERILQLIAAARALLRRHPALVEIRFRRPVLRPESLGFAEASLEVLEGAGFERMEAAQAFRLLFTYTFGFAGLSPEEQADDARREATAAISGLSPDRFPALTAAVAEASQAMSGEEQFQYGLERILDGLESRLAAR